MVYGSDSNYLTFITIVTPIGAGFNDAPHDVD